MATFTAKEIVTDIVLVDTVSPIIVMAICAFLGAAPITVLSIGMADIMCGTFGAIVRKSRTRV